MTVEATSISRWLLLLLEQVYRAVFCKLASKWRWPVTHQWHWLRAEGTSYREMVLTSGFGRYYSGARATLLQEGSTECEMERYYMLHSHRVCCGWVLAGEYNHDRGQEYSAVLGDAILILSTLNNTLLDLGLINIHFPILSYSSSPLPPPSQDSLRLHSSILEPLWGLLGLCLLLSPSMLNSILRLSRTLRYQATYTLSGCHFHSPLILTSPTFIIGSNHHPLTSLLLHKFYNSSAPLCLSTIFFAFSINDLTLT